ncbi:MAG: hypothetical protein HQ464_00210 [Planctomycetes bacterium]|nr:hypothetical protein [Planctomycetota bacterium]
MAHVRGLMQGLVQCLVHDSIVWAAVATATLPAAMSMGLEIDAAALRGQLIMVEEPAGAVTPIAAKAKLTKDPQPIVVAGRVGARGMEPFLENKASFVLVEIPADDHAKAPGHDNDNCPFCKKRQANAPMVAVQFLGADGKVIPIDARKLFGIKKGSDVVIRGQGAFDPKLAIPVIQVTAEAIHVRQAAP